MATAVRVLLLPLILLGGLWIAATQAVQEPTPAAAMQRAAEGFLATLTPDQRDAASFSFTSDDRFDWHFIPRERKGVSLKAMTAAQRDAGLALLRTSLSADGFNKAETIRELEQVLFELEGRAIRDRDLYFFMIFGQPSATGTWGWRYEGHHISQSWTIVGGREVASTPQFFGTNPAEVRSGRLAGTRVLSREEDQARALLASLSTTLRSTAIIDAEAPQDILTAADREAAIQANTGVAYRDLTSQQQAVLWSIIEEYAGVQPPATAAARLQEIRAAGVDGIRFAWMGSTERGEGHYYRIQGPTFLVEYDNVQNDANHVHSVWRDFDGDFGRDLLASHYQRYPHALAE